MEDFYAPASACKLKQLAKDTFFGGKGGGVLCLCYHSLFFFFLHKQVCVEVLQRKIISAEHSCPDVNLLSGPEINEKIPPAYFFFFFQVTCQKIKSRF